MSFNERTEDKAPPAIQFLEWLSFNCKAHSAEALGLVYEDVPPMVSKVQIHLERKCICLVICLLSKNDLSRTVFSCFLLRGIPAGVKAPSVWPGVGLIFPDTPFYLLAPQFRVNVSP